nr:putative disease resistance RPP13-like protein 1 [Tanacetum cinerariifolium]
MRYLNLSRTRITQLPENVCNLYNLQTLIIYGCRRLTKLPNSFSKLKNLRHFDKRDTPLLMKMPLGIGELKILQTLSKIIIGGDNGFAITELKGLKNLRGDVSIKGQEKVENAMHAREAHIGSLNLPNVSKSTMLVKLFADSMRVERSGSLKMNLAAILQDGSESEDDKEIASWESYSTVALNHPRLNASEQAKAYLLEDKQIPSVRLFDEHLEGIHEKLKLSKSQGASTPAEMKRMQNVSYASAIGSIMYAVRCTRPDVAFAQNITSRFQHNPGDIHWTTVKNILKYLRNTKDMFLVYRGDLKRELRVSCYTNTGYLMDANDLKSQTEYVFVLNGANESGITKGARHFYAKVHYLRDVIEFDDIKLEKVYTDDNLADPFTKALAFPKHSEHTKNIGMLPASSLIQQSEFCLDWSSSRPGQVLDEFKHLVHRIMLSIPVLGHCLVEIYYKHANYYKGTLTREDGKAISSSSCWPLQLKKKKHVCLMILLRIEIDAKLPIVGDLQPFKLKWRKRQQQPKLKKHKLKVLEYIQTYSGFSPQLATLAEAGRLCVLTTTSKSYGKQTFR